MKRFLLILVSVVMLSLMGCMPQQQNFNAKTADYGPFPSNYIDPVKEYVKGQLHIGRHQVFVSNDRPVQGMATDQNSLSLALKGQLYGWKGYMVIEDHGRKNLWEYYMRYDQVVGINSYTGPNEEKMIYQVLHSKKPAAAPSSKSASKEKPRSRTPKKDQAKSNDQAKPNEKVKSDTAPKGKVDADGFEIIEHEKPAANAAPVQTNPAASKPAAAAPSKPKKLDADGFEILN